MVPLLVVLLSFRRRRLWRHWCLFPPFCRDCGVGGVVYQYSALKSSKSRGRVALGTGDFTSLRCTPSCCVSDYTHAIATLKGGLHPLLAFKMKFHVPSERLSHRILRKNQRE